MNCILLRLTIAVYGIVKAKQNDFLNIKQRRQVDGLFDPEISHDHDQRLLSQHTGQKCKRYFSVHLALVVIIFNAIKALTILAGILELRNDPLLTVGDAVLSFLQTPDPSSRNMCLVSQAKIHSSKLRWRELQEPWRYTNKRNRWFSAVKEGKRCTVWIS